MTAGDLGVSIRPMNPDDVDDACRVIGLAFAANPSTLANVRGDQTKARRMMERVVRVAKLGRVYSHVLVADQDDRIIGLLNAAPWPHCQLRATDKVRAAPTMVRILGTALPRASKMMTRRARHDPHRPHWHVGPVAVHPEHQGHGVGKALLRSFLNMVDDQGLPAFLEIDVDRNLLLYEMFGFEVAAQEQILGVHTRFMWRQARPTGPAPPENIH
jgi:GNAT superfamily N-acetyltransferase